MTPKSQYHRGVRTKQQPMGNRHDDVSRRGAAVVPCRTWTLGHQERIRGMRRIFGLIEANPIVQAVVLLGLFALVGRCGG